MSDPVNIAVPRTVFAWLHGFVSGGLLVSFILLAALGHTEAVRWYGFPLAIWTVSGAIYLTVRTS